MNESDAICLLGHPRHPLAQQLTLHHTLCGLSPFHLQPSHSSRMPRRATSPVVDTRMNITPSRKGPRCKCTWRSRPALGWCAASPLASVPSYRSKPSDLPAAPTAKPSPRFCCLSKLGPSLVPISPPFSPFSPPLSTLPCFRIPAQ